MKFPVIISPLKRVTGGSQIATDNGEEIPVLKKIILAAATAGIAAATFAVPAQAQALCIYTVGFDHLPNAGGQANPPSVWFDDGKPYVRQVCN